MKATHATLILTLLLAVPVDAQQLPPLRVDIVQQNEWLDERSDWMASTISVGQTGRNRLGWLLTAGRYARFAQVDAMAAAQLWVPLLRGTMIELGAEGSPSSDFLAEWGATLGVQQELGSGWVASARATRRQYPVEVVELGALGVEYYVGEWRGAYTLGIARGESDEAGYAHVGTLSRYVGESGSINVTVAAGREVETIGAGRAVILDVRSFDVWGAAPLSGPVGVVFGAGYSDHETLGPRFRGQAGVRIDVTR